MSSRSPAHRLVVTLQDAHEQVAREWPGRHASAAVLRAYHEHAAGLFEQVAQADPGHQYEARYWAAQERETAQRYASAPSGSTEHGTGAELELEGRSAPAPSTIPLPAKERNGRSEQR